MRRRLTPSKATSALRCLSPSPLSRGSTAAASTAAAAAATSTVEAHWAAPGQPCAEDAPGHGAAPRAGGEVASPRRYTYCAYFAYFNSTHYVHRLPHAATLLTLLTLLTMLLASPRSATAGWEWDVGTTVTRTAAAAARYLSAEVQEIALHRGGCHCGDVRFEVEAASNPNPETKPS
eukprot:scaffold79705_cov30-Phaeocystis_antarctica.AAC.1